MPSHSAIFFFILKLEDDILFAFHEMSEVTHPHPRPLKVP